MTREEAKGYLIDMSYKLGNMAIEYLTEKDGEKMREAIQALSQEPTDRIEYGTDGNAYKLWISNGKEFEQEPCDDAVSRQAVDDYIVKLLDGYLYDEERTRLEGLCAYLWELPSVTQKSETVTEFADRCRECGARYGKLLKQKTGYCKECKYFEYDSVAKVDGVPLIVAHEICSKWGDGCKTKEDGYCFLFEPKESEE